MSMGIIGGHIRTLVRIYMYEPYIRTWQPYMPVGFLYLHINNFNILANSEKSTTKNKQIYAQ